MSGRLARVSGFAGISLSLLFSISVGCGKDQSPPPAQTSAPIGVTAKTTPGAGTPTRNINELQVGMTSEQVKQIMGAPEQTKQEGLEVEWKYSTPQGPVDVKILSDRVTAIERK